MITYVFLYIYIHFSGEDIPFNRGKRYYYPSVVLFLFWAFSSGAWSII